MFWLHAPPSNWSTLPKPRYVCTSMLGTTTAYVQNIITMFSSRRNRCMRTNKWGTCTNMYEKRARGSSSSNTDRERMTSFCAQGDTTLFLLRCHLIASFLPSLWPWWNLLSSLGAWMRPCGIGRCGSQLTLPPPPARCAASAGSSGGENSELNINEKSTTVTFALQLRRRDPLAERQQRST